MSYPLLCAKPCDEMTPAEFLAHINSLYEERKVQAKALGVSAHLSAQGNLVIRTKRVPKWVARTELDILTITTGKPLAQVWNYCKTKGYVFVERVSDGHLLELRAQEAGQSAKT